MALSEDKIVDEGFKILRDYGLAAISMRRLAGDLQVKPGALYYHVDSKQELLVAIAGRVLDDGVVDSQYDADVVTACDRVREALLSVRDGAELVSFVYAFRPDSLAVLGRLGELAGSGLASPQAGWAGQTVIRYVLGFVAEEQNHAELVKAGVLDRGRDRAPADAGARCDVDDDSGEYSERSFRFGVEAILRGVRDSASATQQA